MTIANDFRAEVKRILERYTGKPFDAISPISVEAVRAIDARLDELEDRAAHCTCEASHAALLFELKDRPDEGRYAPKLFAEIASCLADERRLMGEGLVTTAGAREKL